MNNYK